MQNIIEFIKSEMAARGMTYDQLATYTGMTKQNLWLKMNKSVAPNFETIKKILEGLEYELVIEKKQDAGEGTENQDLKHFFESAEEEQVSYECVEKLLSAVGYELKIKTHNNEQNVKKGIDIS